MVLKTDYNKTARWSKDINNWIVEDQVIYCWTDVKGKELTKWFSTFDSALEYLIRSGA